MSCQPKYRKPGLCLRLPDLAPFRDYAIEQHKAHHTVHIDEQHPQHHRGDDE